MQTLNGKLIIKDSEQKKLEAKLAEIVSRNEQVELALKNQTGEIKALKENLSQLQGNLQKHNLEIRGEIDRQKNNLTEIITVKISQLTLVIILSFISFGGVFLLYFSSQNTKKPANMKNKISENIVFIAQN